jgi:hypothetical protein
VRIKTSGLSGKKNEAFPKAEVLGKSRMRNQAGGVVNYVMKLVNAVRAKAFKKRSTIEAHLLGKSNQDARATPARKKLARHRACYAKTRQDADLRSKVLLSKVLLDKKVAIYYSQSSIGLFSIE